MSGPTRHLSGTGSKTQTPADKSKFLQTCNRLSLFLKQNGNIPHLHLTINANSSHTTETSPVTEATTMDLLSNIKEDPAPASAGEKSADANLPQYFILESSSYQVQNSTNKAATSCSKPVKEPKTATAQMTIFYGGQVLVLDDVSADRARDLMLMTNKGRHDKNIDEIENHHVELSKKDSDLPIARRASLHKFLAKRKDREPHNHCPGAGGSSSSGKDHSFDLNM